jgi:hypothetical protein
MRKLIIKHYAIVIGIVALFAITMFLIHSCKTQKSADCEAYGKLEGYEDTIR